MKTPLEGFQRLRPAVLVPIHSTPPLSEKTAVIESALRLNGRAGSWRKEVNESDSGRHWSRPSSVPTQSVPRASSPTARIIPLPRLPRRAGSLA